MNLLGRIRAALGIADTTRKAADWTDAAVREARDTIEESERRMREWATKENNIREELRRTAGFPIADQILPPHD